MLSGSGEIGFHFGIAVYIIACIVGAGVGGSADIRRFFGGIRCHLYSLLLIQSPKHVCRLFGENITLTITSRQQIYEK